MKAIFTLLLATISASALAYDGGKLTITVAANRNVQVIVDGRMYQDNNNSFVLNNIQPGNHSIKVYKKRGNANSGRNANRDRNDQQDLLYSSNVYVRASHHVDVMINRFGKALVDERVISNKRNNDDWYEEDYENEEYNNGGDRYNNDYRRAINDQEFNQLLQRIRNQWIGKQSTAKDALTEHYFTTGQVRQILQLFSSENDQLELARLSYRNLVDRQNFRQLYDLFSRASQVELDRYIREFRS